jgi:ABC-2 type transport system permease protein
MLNYIKAELYRNFNRLYFWVFTGVLTALALFINIVSVANDAPGIGLSMLLNSTLYVLSVPVFLVAMIVDMVTSEENKNQTLRNVITFGIPRHKLMLSKIIVSVILASISALIILGLFYGSGAAFYGIDEGVKTVLPMVSIRLLTAVPLWIGAISIGTFLGMSINNSNLFGFAHAGIFFLTSKIIIILSYAVSDKFMLLNNYLITTRLNNLRAPDITAGELWISALIGLAYTVVFTVLSIIYFNKKEVK